MKRLRMLILAVLVIGISVPAYAADANVQNDQRSECLIASHGCATRAKTINEQIQMLQSEIKKGTKVYTKEEITKLSAKLKDVEDTLDNLMKR